MQKIIWYKYIDFITRNNYMIRSYLITIIFVKYIATRIIQPTYIIRINLLLCICSFIIVCGGVIDANIKGQLKFPIKNVTRFLCEWQFPHTNGTMVIEANFKVNESKLICHYDSLLKAFNGIYIRNQHN